MKPLYKICPEAMWRSAEREGVFDGAPVDLADGFIHLSTAGQVSETAARHFAGQTDLVLLAVDPGALGDALRYEPSRGGAYFPHLYGPLPLAAVGEAVALRLGPDGRHVFPSDVPGAETVEPETEGWIPALADNFIGLVGPLWRRPSEEEAGSPTGTRRYGFLAEARHLNRGGIVHGGMLMTFADQALGMAAWSANGARRQVTIQLDTHFISGVREGEFVEARCRVVRKTFALLFMTGELAVGERVVATASGVWKMRSPQA